MKDKVIPDQLGTSVVVVTVLIIIISVVVVVVVVNFPSPQMETVVDTEM